MSSMFNSIRWRNVRKVLRDATFMIRDEIMPNVKLLLDVYKMSFGYRFKSWNVEADPGMYSIQITGEFDASIQEISRILRSKHGGFLFEAWHSTPNHEEYSNSFTLMIKHPECYRFYDGDGYEI